MAKIYGSMEELIGSTPLVELKRFTKQEGLHGTILAKLEMFNPAGSAKDRVAQRMITDAELAGRLTPGATIIEPTSGNTGIGISAVAAARGYHVILTMPDTMSVERKNLLKAYGARVVLTEGAKGMAGAIEKAEELNREIEDSVILGQFDNPSNPIAHDFTTGPEIYSDTNGKIDYFVAGIGTGGTITGTGRYLKRAIPSIKIIGMEPADSPLISKGYSGPHKIQGIGANFIPKVLDIKVIDDILTVTTEQAYSTCRKLTATEGLLVGISSGAALYAAEMIASLPESEGKRIVVLLPDGGERYLSTPGFVED